MALTEEQKKKLMEKAAAKSQSSAKSATSSSKARNGGAHTSSISSAKLASNSGRHKIQPKQTQQTSNKMPILIGVICGIVILAVVLFVWHPWSPKDVASPNPTPANVTYDPDLSDDDLPSVEGSGTIVDNVNRDGKVRPEHSIGGDSETSTSETEPGTESSTESSTEVDPVTGVNDRPSSVYEDNTHPNKYEGDTSEVSVTIPSRFVGFMMQEDADYYAEQNGYTSATLQSNGDVEYKMPAERLGEELVVQLKSLDDTVASYQIWKDMTHVIGVEVSDDYLTYVITMDDVSDLDQLQAIYEDLYEQVEIYTYWNRTPNASINISFVDSNGNAVPLS